MSTNKTNFFFSFVLFPFFLSFLFCLTKTAFPPLKQNNRTYVCGHQSMSVFLLQRWLQRTQNEKIMTFVGSSSSSPLSSRSLRFAGMGPSLQSLKTFHQYITKKCIFVFSHFQDKMQRTLLIHSDAAMTIVTNFTFSAVFFRTSRIQEYKHIQTCANMKHSLSLSLGRSMLAHVTHTVNEWYTYYYQNVHTKVCLSNKLTLLTKIIKNNTGNIQ